MAERAAHYRADHEAARMDARGRWAPQLQRAATELLDNGATRMILGDRTVEARVITFWRGDSLLHTVTSGPNSRGESLSRISRNPGRAGAEGLFESLVGAVTQG